MAYDFKLGCVILAAGRSIRFGEDDKLLSILGGKPLIGWVLSSLPKNEFDFVYTVTSSDRISLICREAGYEVVQYDGGLMSDSIRKGMEAMPDDIAGIMFINADRPFIRSDTIIRMIEAFRREPDSAVRMTYQGTPSNPVIFPKKAFDALRALEGDRGGGAVLKKGGIRVIEIEAQSIDETYDADDRDTLDKLTEILLNKETRCGPIVHDR